MTFVNIAFGIDNLATPFALTILQNPSKNIAVGMGEGALPIDFAFGPIALIDHPIGHG